MGISMARKMHFLPLTRRAASRRRCRSHHRNASVVSRVENRRAGRGHFLGQEKCPCLVYILLHPTIGLDAPARYLAICAVSSSASLIERKWRRLVNGAELFPRWDVSSAPLSVHCLREVRLSREAYLCLIGSSEEN